MPDDHRMLVPFGGAALSLSDTTFWPLSQTSSTPPDFFMLSRTTSRIQVPRNVAMLPTVRYPLFRVLYVMSLPLISNSSHGPPGFSGENCWNVTGWLWNFQSGLM